MKKIITLFLLMICTMAFTAKQQEECNSRVIIKQLFFDANIYQAKKKLIAELRKDQRFTGGEINQEENPIMGDTYEVCTFDFEKYPLLDIPLSSARLDISNITKDYAEGDLTLYLRFNTKEDLDKATKMIHSKLNNACFKKAANGYTEASAKGKPAEIMIYAQVEDSRKYYDLTITLMYEY